MRSSSRSLLALVLIYVGIATCYNFTTPLFEAPDEIWHFAFVRHVAFQRELPIVKPEAHQAWAQQGTQAPLYYLLGAPLLAWMNESNLQLLPPANPFARIGLPEFASNDNRNAFVHTSDESRFELAVHLLRFFSTLLGAATIVLTYLLACEVFPDQKPLAFAASALVAFLPQFIFISSAINNDNLATTLAAASLLQIARVLRRGITPRRAILLALFIAAALLAKTNALGLVPLALVALFRARSQTPFLCETWIRRFSGSFTLEKPRKRSTPEVHSVRHRRSIRLFVSSAFLFLCVITFVDAWWYIRNAQLYGDPLAFAPALEIVGQRQVSMSFTRWLIAEGEGLRLSLWGVFGWMNILAAPWFYGFFDAFAVIGLIGMIVGIARLASTRDALSAKRVHHTLTPLALLVLWCAILFAAFARWNLLTPAAQGRLLFPALPAYAILWAWGLTALIPAQLKSWVTASVTVLLAVIAISAPFAFIAPAYTPTTALPANIQPLNWRFENGADWIGARVDRATLRAGESFGVTIYHRVAALQPNTALFVHVVNSNDSIIAQRDSLPASGNWRGLHAGDIVADTFRVTIPLAVATPGDLQIRAGMYDRASGRRDSAADREGKRIASAASIATVRLESSADAWNFDFDGQTRLLRAEISPRVIARGEWMRVHLVWSAAPRGYRVFTHILGSAAEVWGSEDTDLEREMEFWVRVLTKTPPDLYPIEIGIYSKTDEARLAIYDARGQLVGDHLLLEPIRVSTK